MNMKKRRDLSLSEKINILKTYDKLPKSSQRRAASQLNISQPLLCKILKNRVEIQEAVKRNANLQAKRYRSGKDAEVETALKLWFSNVGRRNPHIDGPLLRQKAEELAREMGRTFVATEGWFQRWKRRENIEWERKGGGKGAASKWFKNEWAKIMEEFSPNDIYNADETGLYYRAVPEQAQVQDRVTILFCASMSGGKEKPLVIGKRKKPKCFETVNSLPVDYSSSENAWMTSLIFNDWLLKWDKRLDHKIALLVDNHAVHCINCQLDNIKVIFLPCGITITQPLEMGITRTIKAYYRKGLLDRFADRPKLKPTDLAKKMNLLDVIHLINMSWYQVSQATIQNSFKQSGFSNIDTEAESVDIQPCGMTTTDFENWVVIDEDISIGEKTAEEIIFEGVFCKNGTEISAEHEKVERPPKKKEVRKALAVLRQIVQLRACDFQPHYEYEIFINNLLSKN